MEEIHSCGNQCKKLIIKDLLMQRMITHVRKFYNNKVFFFSFDNSLKLLTKVFFIFFFSVHATGTPIKTQKGHHQEQNILFLVVEFFHARWQYKYHYYKALWYIHWFCIHVLISLCINIHFCVKLYLHAHVSKYWLVLRYWFSYSWRSTFIFICDIWLHMIEIMFLSLGTI